MTTSDILEEVAYEGIELPGANSGYDYATMTKDAKDNVKKQLGLSFMRAFKYHGNDDSLDLGGIRIMRKEMPATYESGTTKDRKYYKFSD